MTSDLYYASDYFQFFYDFALALIENGDAYVDEQSPEQIRENRGTLTTPGIDSRRVNPLKVLNVLKKCGRQAPNGILPCQS